MFRCVAAFLVFLAANSLQDLVTQQDSFAEPSTNVTSILTTVNFDQQKTTTIIPTTTLSKANQSSVAEYTKPISESSSNGVTFPPTPDVEVIPEMPAIGDDSSSSNVEVFVEYSFGCPVNNSRPCVPKCCNLNETHTNTTVGTSNRTECVAKTSPVDFLVDFFDLPNYGANISLENRYEYFIGSPCTTGKFVLDPTNYKEDAFSIYSNGSIFYSGSLYGMGDYCVDTLNDQVQVFFCFESGKKVSAELLHILYPVGQLISIPFLLATASTYLLIEKFRDLQGKSLACHVLSLSVAFFFLAFVQMAGDKLSSTLCVVSAFLIQFSFVACFFWLNVLSYDTYRNIRDDFRTIYNRGSTPSERRKFIMYSLYAWNGPIVLLIVSAVLDNVPGIPDSFLKPQFGQTSCWFSSQTAALSYFFGPMGFLIAINIVFFALSAYAILKELKAESATKLTQNEDEDSQEKKKKKKYRKLRIYIKGLRRCFALFIIMGLSWLAEVISWAAGGSKYIWLTTDIINTFQGVLIFIVFVYRPERVRRAVLKNLQHFILKLRHCDLSYTPVINDDHPPARAPVVIPEQDQSDTDGMVPLSTFKN